MPAVPAWQSDEYLALSCEARGRLAWRFVVHLPRGHPRRVPARLPPPRSPQAHVLCAARHACGAAQGPAPAGGARAARYPWCRDSVTLGVCVQYVRVDTVGRLGLLGYCTVSVTLFHIRYRDDYFNGARRDYDMVT